MAFLVECGILLDEITSFGRADLTRLIGLHGEEVRPENRDGGDGGGRQIAERPVARFAAVVEMERDVVLGPGCGSELGAD